MKKDQLWQLTRLTLLYTLTLSPAAINNGVLTLNAYGRRDYEPKLVQKIWQINIFCTFFFIIQWVMIVKYNSCLHTHPAVTAESVEQTSSSPAPPVHDSYSSHRFQGNFYQIPKHLCSPIPVIWTHFPKLYMCPCSNPSVESHGDFRSL